MTSDTQHTWSRTTRYIVAVGLFLFGILLLYISRDVLDALILGALIAFIVRPIISYLHNKLKLPRGIAIILVYIVVILVILLAPLVFIPPIINAVDALLDVDFRAFLDDLMQWLENTLLNLKAARFAIPGLNVVIDSIVDPILNSLQSSEPVEDIELPSFSTILTYLRNAFATGFGLAANVIGTVVSVVVSFGLMILYSFYISSDAGSYTSNFMKIVPESEREEVSILISRLIRTWDAFLGGQLKLMLFIGVTVWIGNVILGNSGALALGLISGVLELIPSLGPALALIPGVLTALIQGSSHLPVNNLTFALIVLIFYLLVQVFENNFLVPKVMGDAVKLPNIIVLLSVIVGATTWGILGALLATPIFASIREIVSYLYRKVLGEDPYPGDEEIEEEESVALTTSVTRWIIASQQFLNRQLQTLRKQDQAKIDVLNEEAVSESEDETTRANTAKEKVQDESDDAEESTAATT
ncbi:MAG: AI-2E family transporter [Anaerolineales bacterium]|nr:AI-2E family transporter [Anaerolineales bacterium]